MCIVFASTPKNIESEWMSALLKNCVYIRSLGLVTSDHRIYRQVTTTTEWNTLSQRKRYINRGNEYQQTWKRDYYSIKKCIGPDRVLYQLKENEYNEKWERTLFFSCFLDKLEVLMYCERTLAATTCGYPWSIISTRTTGKRAASNWWLYASMCMSRRVTRSVSTGGRKKLANACVDGQLIVFYKTSVNTAYRSGDIAWCGALVW